MGDSFTVLGGGEGFGLNSGEGFGNIGCAPKIDVSRYDYWTTYSGVSKTSPAATPVLIQESLVLAMKMYWLGKKSNVNCTFKQRINTDDPFEQTKTAVEQGYDVYDIRNNTPTSEDNPWKPEDRACPLPRQWDCEPNPDPFFPDDCYMWTNAQIATGDDNDRLNMQFRPQFAAYAMYNGSVNEPNNFVGYGAGFGKATDFNGGGVAGAFSFPSTLCFSSACWCGFCDDLAESQEDRKIQSTSYTTENGIHVIALASASNFEIKEPNAPFAVTIKSVGTASGNSASARTTRRFRIPDTDPPEYEMRLTDTSAVSVSSIEYYTI